MIRAVIFDMGGTLLRYIRPGNGTWRELEDRGIRGLYRYLAEQGHDVAADEDAFVEEMFARLAEGWEQATGGKGSMRAIDWIAAGMAARPLSEAALMEAAHSYARPLRDGVVPTPGAAATLAALRSRGLRTGLISNTIWPSELHLEDLAETGLLPYLERWVFSGDFGAWKPQPRVFQHMLDELEVSAADAIFVGDSPREDVRGAQAVGMRAVWMRSAEFALGDVLPDAIVETLPELLSYLDTLGDDASHP